MAKTVGGITCTFVKGNIGDQRERVEVWQIPGVDGTGSLLIGMGDSRWRFSAILYDTRANIETWSASLEGLQGSVITVVEDFGLTFTNLLVLRVHTPANIQNAYVAGGAVRYRASIVLEGVVV